MSNNCNKKILEDYSRVGENKITYQQLMQRLKLCRLCNHWYETNESYRCFSCKCDKNFLYLKDRSCPLPTSQW